MQQPFFVHVFRIFFFLPGAPSKHKHIEVLSKQLKIKNKKKKSVFHYKNADNHSFSTEAKFMKPSDESEALTKDLFEEIKNNLRDICAFPPRFKNKRRIK